MMTDISDNLRVLMAERGITAAELERLTEGAVKQSTISRIISRKRRGSSPVVKILADFFRITVKQLRGEQPLNPGIFAEYPAGPLPEGCDPEAWAEVPERINEMNREPLAQFAEAFVRQASLEDPHDQRLLKEIYCIWLKCRKAAGIKKSIAASPTEEYKETEE